MSFLIVLPSVAAPPVRNAGGGAVIVWLGILLSGIGRGQGKAL